VTATALVMAYGSPTRPEQIAEYYTDIRRGRPPSAEQLAELERRYAAIGGCSPLAERTAAQVAAIGVALEEIAPGAFTTAFGAKHTDPKIEAAIAHAAEAGTERIVAVVLAPHYAAASVGEYLERARTTAAQWGVPLRAVERYGEDPVLLELLAERVADALTRIGSAPEDRETEVIFTAHALPLRSIRPDDRYAEEIAATAAGVAARLGLARWRTGWQSAGMTPDPWLGPDILPILDESAGSGARRVVICPCGFTSDHLEVLYDLDVLAAGRCAELGITYARTGSLNDDRRFAALVARRIVEA
jgi:ferrochelatase